MRTRSQGAFSFNGNGISFNQGFRFHTISEAIGDVRVTVVDQDFYYAEGAPHLAGAHVTFTDPVTNEVVAEGNTDANGQFSVTDIPEGTYQLQVTAKGHSTFRGPFEVQPGIVNFRTTEDGEEDPVFLNKTLVSYNWTVVPTQIEDNYKIVLEPTFETNVPVPVVTIDNPFIMPVAVIGETTQFEVQLTNHGLIQAENVRLSIPEDPNYIITPLIDNVPILPAKSSITIPVSITPRAGVTLGSLRAQAEALNANPAWQAAKRANLVAAFGADAAAAISAAPLDVPCLPPITISAIWAYLCGKNVNTQGVNGTVSPVTIKKSTLECVLAGLKGAGIDVAKSKVLGKDLYGAPCAFIDAFIACAAPDLTRCQKALISAGCKGIKGAITGGPAGAAAGVASGALGLLNCLCGLFTPPPPSDPININIGFGEFSGGGGGFGGAFFAPTGWSIPVGNACAGALVAGSANQAIGNANGQQVVAPEGSVTGVCAQVKIRIEQKAVITRNAFLGTLELSNGHLDQSLRNVRLQLNITDEEGNDANDMFAVRGPVLDTLTAVDGTGVLAPDSSGTAQYTFIPRRDAAPEAPVVYRIGGTLSYFEDANGDGVQADDGTEPLITVPLLPGSITVYPDPNLELDYFLQRDVIGDDPFTEEVEPSEPFSLGLIVTNTGHGDANNFKITTAQPKIVENDKGLLIEFQIIGTKVGNEEQTPSLTVNFGDIKAGDSEVAQFIMTSTLQGKFVSYDAKFEHVDGLGDERLSLIESVNLHEMIHVVQTGYAEGDEPDGFTNDDIPDFLANDVPDASNTPDRLYSSDGSVLVVNEGTNESISSTGGLSYHLTANQVSGLTYLTIADPTDGRYQLREVIRSDGRKLLINDNVWTTRRTFSSSDGSFRRENVLHLLDFDGTGDYTVVFRKEDETAPTITDVVDVSPDPRGTAVSSVEVTFSEAINPSTFDYHDLTLTRGADNTNLITNAVQIEQVDETTYRITGLEDLTDETGEYTLTVNATGIQDPSENAGEGTASDTWVMDTGNVSADVAAVSTPRNSAVSEVDVTFSQAINGLSFTRDDVSLTLDGSLNLITGSVTIDQIGERTFRIRGLETLTTSGGLYELTVNATGVTTPDGDAGVGSDTSKWTLDTVAPTITDLEDVTTNPRNIVVPRLDVTFSEAIDPDTFDEDDLVLTRGGTPVDLHGLIGHEVVVSHLSGNTFRITELNWFQGLAGEYVLTVDPTGIRDLAGNAGTGSDSTSWTLILGEPDAPDITGIVPDNGSSSTDGRTNSLSLTINGTGAAPGTTITLFDTTTSTDLGDATVTGSDFSHAVTFAQGGAHRIRARAVDVAGNVVVANGVLLNDFDYDPDDVLTAVVVDEPAHGTVTLAEDGSFVYSPNDDFNGEDHFTYYTANDGDLDSNVVTVTITITEVNDAPTGVNDDLASVAEDSGVRTITFADLLGNDAKGPANESGLTLTITAVSNPIGGTVAIVDGHIEFTPTANFNGAASFTYTLQDNGTTNSLDDVLTNTANVSFTVTAVNDVPSFTKGPNVTTLGDEHQRRRRGSRARTASGLHRHEQQQRAVRRAAESLSDGRADLHAGSERQRNGDRHGATAR